MKVAHWLRRYLKKCAKQSTVKEVNWIKSFDTCDHLINISGRINHTISKSSTDLVLESEKKYIDTRRFLHFGLF